MSGFKYFPPRFDTAKCYTPFASREQNDLYLSLAQYDEISKNQHELYVLKSFPCMKNKSLNFHQGAMIFHLLINLKKFL
jgi:hypothetical protein